VPSWQQVRQLPLEGLCGVLSGSQVSLLWRRAYAIRDYYPFWKSRNERSRAGKLLLLDPADENVIQIFFDDNIGHGSANIVDVRDAKTGEPLAFQVCNCSSADPFQICCALHRWR